MRFKKFIIIPILIILYVFFIDSIIVPAISQSEYTPTTNAGNIEGQRLTIATTVSVSVSRPYLLGLIYLPIQIGDVQFAWMHENFFFVIFVLTVLFVFMEL